MKARVARKVLARGARAPAGTYRLRTTRQALRLWQRHVGREMAAGGPGPFDGTASAHAWRWAWSLRAQAAQLGIKGRRAWLAQRQRFAEYVRAHVAGVLFSPALARVLARRKVADAPAPP